MTTLTPTAARGQFLGADIPSLISLSEKNGIKKTEIRIFVDLILIKVYESGYSVCMQNLHWTLLGAT